MKMQKYIYWRDDQMYFGYFEHYPDCWIQGETRGKSDRHLRRTHGRRDSLCPQSCRIVNR